MTSKTNRKSATGLLLVQWSRFSHINIKLEGSSLITGVNGTGKSTVLDAVTYLLTGNTQFNIAAKDRDRNIAAYVRGDTRSDGKARYLREGDVVSYIAMEFYSPEDNGYFTVFVCIEMTGDQSPSSYWFVARNAGLADINFYEIQENKLVVTPKNQLKVKDNRITAKEFMGRDKGTEQVLKALGLRCSVAKYRSKLVKMMAFDPQKNIDKFIQECVLEPGEMTSLASLREQRSHFDEIQDQYRSMLASKKKLEEIEEGTRLYEQKCDELNKRKLMFTYQEWKKTEEEIQSIQGNCRLWEVTLKNLQGQLNGKKEELEEAKERQRRAENNDTFQGIENIIKDRESDLKRLEARIGAVEIQYSRLLELSGQIADVKDILSEYGRDLSQYSVLERLENEEIPSSTKREAYIRFAAEVEEVLEKIRKNKYSIEGQLGDIRAQIGELETQKKTLESNRFVYGRDFIEARTFIQKELKKQGIDTDVRFFVELISEIKDRKWRKAVETFLGNKRFNIIVDGKYCKAVLDIINANKSLKSKVVVTDKLPESEVRPDSAAALLEISNTYARRYANYLLNGIHLCETTDELHEYPLGGLMANGMLAKSYAVSKMEMAATRLFIGQDAIKQQLEDTIKEIGLKQNQASSLSDREDTCSRQIRKLSLDWKSENYSFEAPEELKKAKESKVTIGAEIKKYKNDPGFMSVLEERETAKKEADRLDGELAVIHQQIGAAKQQIQDLETDVRVKTDEAVIKEKQFEEEAGELPAYRQAAIDEYKELRAKQKDAVVIAKRTVDDWENQKKNAAAALERLHFDYCRINGQDSLFVGVSFIQHYREEYRNLANVRIEEAQARLEEQSHKLQSAFASDFVAELDAAIRDAKEEIDKINRELRQLPFGADTYCFKMEERPDRRLFFDICRKMHEYLNNAEYYLNSIKDDESAERQLQDFLDIILSEEDESEYTDYRKYFTYDMKITSKQGDSVVTADYSNKQGSASNGEKQTPYFIILAASLMQCYPRQKCCARLAFIDEAFSALSKERIEQMVKYLEDNDFQVIYAAPPEKINSIGRHIQSTISLISKGRYTYAVEGLVKAADVEGE